ncbi:zinc finger protein 480-like isoform X4 [Bacillus rossius redtenbacheri]|uniref:zinc finger protein 480-like isoform X4 n=1 Tax=Bacillus rossius redtenbacheri TaxID=93214 RepID=UPI002FDCFDCF
MRRRLKHYVIYLQFVIFFAHLVVVLCDLCCICNEIGKRGNLDKRSSGAYKRCLNGGSSGGELFCDRKVQVSVKEEERDTSVSWKGEGKMPITDLFIAVKKERDLLSEMEKVDESKGKNITADLVPYIKVEPEVSSDMIKNCDIKTENDVITVEEHVLFQEDTELYANLADVLSCLKNITPATEGKSKLETTVDRDSLLKSPSSVDVEMVENFSALECKEKNLESRLSYYHGRNKHQKYGEQNKCNICDKHFKKAYSLKRHHLNVHLGLKSYRCSMCCSSFTTKLASMKHMLSEHEDSYLSDVAKLRLSAEEYHCSQCGKIFYCRGTMVNHIRVHSEDRPFACHLCNKYYTTRSNLNVHLASHGVHTRLSDVSLYQVECDSCKKQFYCKSHLRDHLKSSCSLKCNSCKKVFDKLIHFRRHIKMCAFNWPVSCSVCGCGFLRKNSLTRYMQKHDPTFYYECEYCKKHFKRRSVLVYHLQQKCV